MHPFILVNVNKSSTCNPFDRQIKNTEKNYDWMYKIPDYKIITGRINYGHIFNKVIKISHPTWNLIFTIFISLNFTEKSLICQGCKGVTLVFYTFEEKSLIIYQVVFRFTQRFSAPDMCKSLQICNKLPDLKNLFIISKF